MTTDEHIKHQISCFKAEKSKIGASQIDKLSLGGRIAALEELLVFINEDKAKNATPITADFLRRNFRDFKTNKYSAYVLTAATTAEQTPVSVDVFLREKGDAMVYVYGEPDNVLNVHTVGELITFLNLCGLNDFASKLKI